MSRPLPIGRLTCGGHGRIVRTDMPGDADPVRDPDRLDALRRLQLLDAPASAAFDRLARLARRVFAVSAAFVTLIDDRREFFLASDGLDHVLGGRREIPADLSCCQHVVRECAPVVVADAGVDRSPAAATLRGIGARAYLGVPLRADGLVVGALAVANREPRRFSEADVGILADLAESVSTEIELQARHREAVGRRDQLEVLVHERTALLEQLNARLRRSEQALRLSREHAIQRLSRAIELRNEETGWHVDRMASYSALLARRAGLGEERTELLRLASPLHDIGKIAIPDRVLLKPGAFTPAERRVMERHAELGYRMLRDSGEELLELAATLARTHHERIDGCGYPRGLAGDAIPVEGRIAAVADVFDALTSNRPYRSAFSLDQASSLMRSERGSHLDADLLDLFLASLDDVAVIAARYPEPGLRAG